MNSTSVTERRSPLHEPSYQLEINDSQEAVATLNQLSPTDHGLAAWRLLGTAFVFESLLWGMHFPCRIPFTRLMDSRIPSFIRSLPELLLRAARIHRKPIHLGCRYSRLGYLLSRRTSHSAIYQALPKIPATNDLGWM